MELTNTNNDYVDVANAKTLIQKELEKRHMSVDMSIDDIVALSSFLIPEKFSEAFEAACHQASVAGMESISKDVLAACLIEANGFEIYNPTKREGLRSKVQAMMLISKAYVSETMENGSFGCAVLGRNLMTGAETMLIEQVPVCEEETGLYVDMAPVGMTYMLNYDEFREVSEDFLGDFRYSAALLRDSASDKDKAKVQNAVQMTFHILRPFRTRLFRLADDLCSQGFILRSELLEAIYEWEEDVNLRTEEEVKASIGVLFDLVWLARKNEAVLNDYLYSGHEEKERIARNAFQKIADVRQKYSVNPHCAIDLNPDEDPFSYGYICGELSALRWVAGDDWHNIDT